MREIEFRGKDKNTNEWVYGNLVNQCEQSFIDVVALTKNDLKVIYPNDYEGFFTHHNFIQVKPETVGQYTGLKDKNGTKIFEGDIVSYDTKNKRKHYSVMEYDVFNCACCWGVYGWCLSGDVDIREFQYNNSNIIVVGNIFDNNELLTNQNEGKGE